MCHPHTILPMGFFRPPAPSGRAFWLVEHGLRAFWFAASGGNFCRNWRIGPAVVWRLLGRLANLGGYQGSYEVSLPPQPGPCSGHTSLNFYQWDIRICNKWWYGGVWCGLCYVKMWIYSADIIPTKVIILDMKCRDWTIFWNCLGTKIIVLKGRMQRKINKAWNVHPSICIWRKTKKEDTTLPINIFEEPANIG